MQTLSYPIAIRTKKNNADRDYVACQNIARKVLWENKLKNMSKAFVYKAKAISDKLYSSLRSRTPHLIDRCGGAPSEYRCLLEIAA